MKSFLATTAIVLLMGGSAYAAPAQFNSYQAQASDIDASKLIGQTVYSSKNDVNADQQAAAGTEKDWDNIGEINELVIGRDGSVKAVVLGVGGFLGLGEKNVAVSMNDIKFVRNGNGANDYFLVINSTKEALNSAPSFRTPDEVRSAQNNANAGATDANNTAANTTMTPAATTNDTAANSTMNQGAATTTDSAANSTMNSTSADSAANTTATPADNSANQASNTMNNSTSGSTDTTTTASTTNNNTAVQNSMDDNRARLTPPTVNREGYQAAQANELTADKLEGARVYGPKDEDVGEINRLVLDDKGQVKMFVLDIGGFLGIGEHQIAVTPGELNIVRDAKGDDFRVYIDANKQALEAQPEYKG